MAGFNLDARARLSIELALTAGRGDPIFARQQEIDAKAVAEAEVDMARKGSSFDFRLSKAIGLALKPDAGHRERAMKAGIDARACADIERLAASYYVSRSLSRSA
jgi:hypothetical protein